MSDIGTEIRLREPILALRNIENKRQEKWKVRSLVQYEAYIRSKY